MYNDERDKSIAHDNARYGWILIFAAYSSLIGQIWNLRSGNAIYLYESTPVNYIPALIMFVVFECD